MESKNYYNVDILYLKDDKPEGVQLVAYTKDEIKKYLNYISESKLGKQPIGHRKANVVDPETFRIFDFSKVISFKNKSRPELEEELRKKVNETKDYLTAFKQLGKDVTDEFNIQLEDILGITYTNITTPEEQVFNEDDSEIQGGKDTSLEIEPGKFGLTGSMKGQIKSGSSVEGNLTAKVSSFYPKEHKEGIFDSLVEPAFEVEKIASVFASHLKNLKKDESGQMIGAFGQWGRGKTYFISEVFKQLNLIQKIKEKIPFRKRAWNLIESKINTIKSKFKKREIKEESSLVLVKFQAWRYQQTPSIWAYLFETFINKYLEVNCWEKIWRHFNLTLARKGYWRSIVWPLISIVVGIIVFIFTLNLFDNSQNRLIVKVLGLVGTLILAYQKVKSILKKLEKPATTIFDSFSKAPSFKSVLGVQAEIEKELKHLLKAWKKYIGDKRILLFVDDLDRCNEGQIIDIIDSLRVILDDKEIKKQVLILVALDEEKLKKAIKLKFIDLFKEPDKLQNIVSEYMDKLFISAIKLFPISLDDREEFVRKLAAQINGKEKNRKESVPEPTSTPTSISEITEPEDDKISKEDEAPLLQTATPAPTSEPKQSNENLESLEISMVIQKVRSIQEDITPRQIRILIYRYLLARNIWRILYSGTEFNPDDAIYAIMRYSGLVGHEKREIFPGLAKITRMVVAY